MEIADIKKKQMDYKEYDMNIVKTDINQSVVVYIREKRTSM